MKKDAELILLSGGRGCGKTTQMREKLQDKKRVIALDPMQDLGLKGFTELKTIGGILRHIKRNWNTGFKISVPTGHNPARCQAFFVQLSKALFMVQTPYKEKNPNMVGKEIWLGIDEVHKFIPNPPSDEVASVVQDFIDVGRHYGINMIGATQRIVKVWTEYRGNCMKNLFFRQADHNDIDNILRMIGRDKKDDLLALKTHEFIMLDRANGLEITKGKNKANFK